MKPVTKIYIVSSLIVLLASSCGPVTPVATTSASPAPHLATPLPSTITLLPSKGPDKDVLAYRLRSWAEDDYNRIVDSLDGLIGEEAGQISYFHMPDYRAAFRQEYLLRFPNSSDRNSILWNILFNKPETVAIPGTLVTSDLMSSIISDLLTQGIQPADLSSELEKYDLQVMNTMTMQNMIGNEEDGLVLLIKMYGVDAPLVGVFVIFRERERFHVQKIRDWEASEAPALSRHFEISNVGDTNGNGLPEIVVQIQAYSGGIAKENIDHIEWSIQNEMFQNTSFQVFWQSCDYGGGLCEGDWEFTTFDSQNVLTVRSYWPTRKDCPAIASQHTFIWNGTQYTSERGEILPPDDDFSAGCLLAWAETAIWMPSSAWSGDFLEPGWKNDLAISIVEQKLKDWPTDADEIWGPAGRDYFKLKLGIWYEFRNEAVKAKHLLQQVANKPVEAEYDFVSRLASLYLEQREDFGKVRACLELESAYFDELRIIVPEPSLHNNEEAMLDAWGIVAGNELFCDVYSMLPADVHEARLTSPISLMQWLERIELTVYQQIPIDLNEDDVDDYVVLLDTLDAGSSDAWAFLGTPNGYQATYISEIFSEDDQSKVDIQSMEIDDDMPVHLILSDEEDLIAFRLTSDGDVENLVWEYGVQALEIDVMSKSVLVQIDNDYDGQRTVVHRWDAGIQNLVEQTDGFTIAQAEIEKKLYVVGDYYGTISSVDNFLAVAPPEPQEAYVCSVDIPEGCKYLPEWYVPYFRYLRGLAYEQLEQNEQARQAYFELWRDFPENVFGMAAGLKLEPIR